jgi:integrase/recombinase XerD
MQIVCKYIFMKAKTAVILDQRRALANGKYPVKLRITFNRKQRYYPCDISFSIEEYGKVVSKLPKGLFKEMSMKLNALEQKALTIITGMNVFDFENFETSLYSEQMVREDVYAYYDKMISRYCELEQMGTAANYRASLTSLRKFRQKLEFIGISVDFLKKYEKWLIDNGRSVSTVGIYLRPLRSVVNHAIADGTLSKDFNYPFGSKSKNKYQIPKTRNIKKALNKSDLHAIFTYKPSIGTWEEKALDFWKFTYLSNGINMKDIANLMFKDIQGEYIRFVRAKTAYTNNVLTPISVFVTDDIKLILEKWGNKDKSAGNLIFEIISATDSLDRQREKIQQFLKMVNKYMGIIGKNLKIDKQITTMTARHSFSTVLKRSGVGIQQISEALGHSSINTTKSYLDSFEDDVKKEMAKALTAFE